jgi:hypothetical protein
LLTCYLLFVPQGWGDTHFSHCGGAGLCNWGLLRLLLLLCVRGWCGWERTIFWNMFTPRIIIDRHLPLKCMKMFCRSSDRPCW